MRKQRATPQHDRVRQQLDQRDRFTTEGQWLSAIADGLAEDSSVEQETLEALVWKLRGHYGGEYTKILDEHEAHIAFWKKLAESFPEQPILRAIYADTLLISGVDRAICLEEFLAAVRVDPAVFPECAGDFYDVARELGRERFLDFRLAELRYAVATAREYDDEDKAHIHELTRDLLTEFGTDTATIARIRAIAAGSR